MTTAKNISPYLVEGPDAVVVNRSKPLCDVPPMVSGNKPIDDGNYLFTPAERETFIRAEPGSEPYFKRWLGGEEFINNIERWCLWLGNVPPEVLRKLPESMKRIQAVSAFRAASNSAPTKKLALTPTKFHTTFVADRPYLAMPQVSSERRRFIPIAYLTPDYLVGDKLRLVLDATPFHFGVLTSSMHMAWVNRVTGRLKSDYQYSVKLVYNNYPWPTSATEAQREAVAARAEGVLAARRQFPASSLADLYDPATMPPALVKAHAELDRAVEKCYRPAAFATDRERVEFLFALYEQLAAPLTAGPAKRRVIDPRQQLPD